MTLTPISYDLFSWATIEPVETSYTVARKTPSTRASELILSPP